MYTLYSHMSDCFNQHAYLMILFDLFCVRSLVRSVHGVPARHATPPRQAHQPRCSRVVPTAWDRSKRRARKQSQLMATESANDRKIKNTKESNFSKAKQPQKWRCWNHGAFWVSSAWLNATSMNKKWQLSALLLAKQETGKQSVLHVSSSLGWQLIWSMCPPCDAEKSQGCKLRRCLMTFVWHVSHFVALVVFFSTAACGTSPHSGGGTWQHWHHCRTKGPILQYGEFHWVALKHLHANLWWYASSKKLWWHFAIQTSTIRTSSKSTGKKQRYSICKAMLVATRTWIQAFDLSLPQHTGNHPNTTAMYKKSPGSSRGPC